MSKNILSFKPFKEKVLGILQSYPWLTAYCIYLSIVLYIGHPSLTPLIHIPLGGRLELGSVIGLLLTYFFFEIVFIVKGTIGVSSKADRIWITFIISTFFIGCYLLYDLVALHNLTILEHFIAYGVIVTFLVLIDLYRIRNHSGEIDTNIASKSIFYGADLPLIVSLLIVFLFGLTLKPEEQELFLGGALALKIGYYYGAFCLLNTFIL